MRPWRVSPSRPTSRWSFPGVLVILAAWSSLAVASAVTDWNLVKSREGVEVFRREVPDSKIYAIRAVAPLDASPQQVLGVIADHREYFRWVDRLQSARILERKSPWDFVTYQVFDMPAMFSDRDTVLRVRIEPGPAPGDIVVRMRSIDHPDAPPTVGVRAKIRGATYRLRAREDGTTELDWDTLSDPGGNIPSWVINMLSKTWPIKSISAMRNELIRGQASPWPMPNE